MVLIEQRVEDGAELKLQWVPVPAHVGLPGAYSTNFINGSIPIAVRYI